MRIEILYIPGCPNYQPVAEQVQRVLAFESVKAGVTGIPVTTEGQAKALLFPGSPTVRINGQDVEPLRTDHTNATGLTCRLYANRTGIPSEDSLRLAVLKAKSAERHP
jgi:hypothetical protein